ncbi:DUF917 domain-containing protein [Hephaestia sp. GCM10023244]|uniref:DUF917 domain-containing protein n=1 Tax=unclassified Hephaestia TaxID=2631281 RepID=UPI0020771AAC|nr:DUF917 domain-containing protein [Hephaestia sp. MAHUQ-44]MCM8732473.1 DUF917 domain-containing protein [Hephaestia sp. MAHUQ-44]
MIGEIGLDEIEDLAVGSAFLGTGGGGDPYLGSLLCREAIGRFGPVRLLDITRLADDDAVFGAAAMGAPTVMIEKLFSIEDQDRAVRALERFLGRTATAITSLEIGGCNSMMPIAYAAMRGLPIVDADGMGRAFPQLQMTSFNIGGVACAPMTLADEHGNVVLFETENGKKAEELARPVVAAMGAAGCMSCYPMTGAQARAASVPGTLSAAIAIGQAIAGKRHAGGAPVERLIAALREQSLYGEARCAFEGKIVAVERVTRDGWVFGNCEIKALESPAVASVAFQNENLSVSVAGRLRCIVPDLITIVDTESAHAIPTERLSYGQRVSVIVCVAPPQLTTPDALPVVGPAGFGLDGHYRPLTELMD